MAPSLPLVRPHRSSTHAPFYSCRRRRRAIASAHNRSYFEDGTYEDVSSLVSLTSEAPDSIVPVAPLVASDGRAPLEPFTSAAVVVPKGAASLCGPVVTAAWDVCGQRIGTANAVVQVRPRRHARLLVKLATRACGYSAFKARWVSVCLSPPTLYMFVVT